jgi:FkbM family methyltransferase
MNVIAKTNNYIRNRYLYYKSGKLIGRGYINLIDVGSAGPLPSPWLENPDKIGNLLKFEPRAKESSNSFVQSFNIALAGNNGTRNLHVYRGFNGTGSSFYEQNIEYVRENFENLKLLGPKKLAQTWFERSQLDHIEKVNCRTLDSVLEQLNDDFIYHFLKIDAQGAEYEILNGAEEFLKNDCIGLHLELFTIPLYKNIKLLNEIQPYLAELGFQLGKKYPPHGSFNSQNDCLFLKENVTGNIINIIKMIYRL